MFYELRRWLQLRFDFDSTGIRIPTIPLPLNCNSTALRPFNELCYDQAAALRPK